MEGGFTQIITIMENEVEILVADDEPAVALAIKSALKFCGYAVQTVPNGAAALECIQAEPGRFGLMLTDHNMPGLGGLALVKALRAAGFPGRIVILSAFLSRSIEAQYVALGVDQILSKPFNLERLRLAMEQALHPVECVVA
jgi:CheY-like chemotaxis protein